LDEKDKHLIARLARELGFLDEIKYRNICIREDLIELRENGLTVEKAELSLSEKYFLSPERIHSIVYNIC